MQSDKPRPKITIKRKPRNVNVDVNVDAKIDCVNVDVNVDAKIDCVNVDASIAPIEVPSAGQVPTPAPDEPERAKELTAKQLKKQRRRERQAAEAALLAAAEAEAARVAEEQAEAERAAVAAAEEARIAAARAAKAARIAALTPEERAELERAKAEKVARMEAEKAAGLERRIEALRILDTNPIFHYFKPLAIGSDKELIAWVMKEGKGRLSSKAIGAVIWAHCNHPHYLKKLILGGNRYSPLSGKAEGEVTKEQKIAAYKELEGYNNRKAERRKSREADTLEVAEVLPEVLPSEEVAEVLPEVLPSEEMAEVLPDVTETLPQGQEPLSSEG